MNHLETGYKITLAIMVFIMAVSITTVYVPFAYSHGGKTHGGEAFSALQALQKATQLYDRLVTSGKLTDDWEIRLVKININTRHSAEKREYVVQFERDEGDPKSVYFFFDQNGEYSGSNFTGD